MRLWHPGHRLRAWPRACDIAAENNREGPRHRCLPSPVRNRSIHRVHARRANLDQYLARSRLRRRNLRESRSCSVCAYGYGAHMRPPNVGHSTLVHGGAPHLFFISCEIPPPHARTSLSDSSTYRRLKLFDGAGRIRMILTTTTERRGTVAVAVRLRRQQRSSRDGIAPGRDAVQETVSI